MQSMFGASERLLYLLEIVVSPSEYNSTLLICVWFINAIHAGPKCLCDLSLSLKHKF